MKKKLKKFLKKHGAWKKFKKNLKKKSDWDTYNFIDEPLRNISGAFDWEGTKEGYEFWQKLSEKWRKICET